MMKKGLFLLLLLWLWMIPAEAAYQPQYSVAGFYPLDDTGRTVYSMNPAWRFQWAVVKQRIMCSRAGPAWWVHNSCYLS